MPTRTLVFIALALPCLAWAGERAMPEHYAWLGTHLSQYWPYHEEIGPDFIEQATLPGLQTGYRHSSGWSLQGQWERNSVKFGNAGRELKVHNSWLSLRRHITGLVYEPYFGINAGQLAFESRQDRDDETLIGLEGGMQTRIQPHWVVDVGVRIPKSVDNERVDIQAWIGLNHVFNFGDKAGPASTASSVQPASETSGGTEQRSLRDSDRDGVPDERDQCPGTDAGRSVNASGCADGS